jgi:DNA-binding transcriptional MerR regulator
LENKNHKIKEVMDYIKQYKKDNGGGRPFSSRKQTIQPSDVDIESDLVGSGKLLKPEERREHVKRLRYKGVSISSIAKILRVSEKTVSRDLTKIYEERRSSAINLDPWEQIGETIEFFREVEEQSMLNATASGKNPSHRNGFLNTAIKARIERAKFQLEVGVIPRAADRRLISVEINGKSVDKLTTDELIEYKKALLEKLSRNQLTDSVIEGELIRTENQNDRPNTTS